MDGSETAADRARSEFASFLEPDWDANAYSNKVLSKTDGSSELGAAISKLSFGIEDLNRRLRTEVATHHAALLAQAASVTTLGDSLTKVRAGLGEVEGGVERLRRKISVPYTDLSTSLARLGRLQRASDLARRASRFVTLVRRLEVQMADYDTAQAGGEESRERGERALGEAALTLAELETLREEAAEQPAEGGDSADLEPLSLRSIPAIEAHMPNVDKSRQQVLDAMEDMVRQGLTNLNQALLASSLQTAFNLSVLPTLVSSLITDLTEAVEIRVRQSFDIAALAREMGGKDATSTSAFGYKSRARTEPTSITLPQWTAAFWAKLELLMEDIAGCCIKVYTLEHVLKVRKEPTTQLSFLDEAMTALENKPSLIFWTTLSQALESQARAASKASTFIAQTLTTGYPRLLRLFHEFFAKIAVHTDTTYTQAQQSPETILILKSVNAFEQLYISRATNRMNEAVAATVAGGARSPPGAGEGVTAARTLNNELDAARFDPILVKAIARAFSRATDAFVSRTRALVSTDHAATSLVGPVSPPSQSLNLELLNAMYHFWQPLDRAATEYPGFVRDIVAPSIASVKAAFLEVADPLLTAMRRETGAIVSRMHRVDFGPDGAGLTAGGSSQYMKDLTDKVSYIRQEVLGAMRVGDLLKEWVLDLAKYIVQHFVLHASLVKPLGENGKLRLTSDMTALEFAISQLLSQHKLNLNALGPDFKALRAFRPLLFADNQQLLDPAQTQDVPPLVLLHQVLVRSPMPLPHQQHSWQEAAYLRWIEEHDVAEPFDLILKEWEPVATDESKEYVALLRTLLDRSRGSIHVKSASS